MLPHGVKQVCSGADLDPEDTINTTLEDGELVEVLVQKGIKIGRSGIPEPSEFHTKVRACEMHIVFCVQSSFVCVCVCVISDDVVLLSALFVCPLSICL